MFGLNFEVNINFVKNDESTGNNRVKATIKMIFNLNNRQEK